MVGIFDEGFPIPVYMLREAAGLESRRWRKSIHAIERLGSRVRAFPRYCTSKVRTMVRRLAGVTDDSAWGKTPHRKYSSVPGWFWNLFKVVWGMIAFGLLTNLAWRLGYGQHVPLNTVSPRVESSSELTGGLLPYGSSGSWLIYLALVMVTLCLTVLPVRTPTFLGVGQGLSALYLAATTYFFASFQQDLAAYQAEVFGPGCLYEGCWPVGMQQYLLPAPILFTTLAMLLMATVFRHRHWAWRMLIPVVIFLAATLVQVLIWDSLVLPWLGSPPS